MAAGLALMISTNDTDRLRSSSRPTSSLRLGRMEIVEGHALASFDSARALRLIVIVPTGDELETLSA